MRYVSSGILCIAIGFFLWQSFDLAPYQAHHIQAHAPSSVERNFLEDVEIVSSPLKEDWLIKYINGAQKEIKVALYMFTVPSMREALLRAKERGVDVRVLLEENPYNATSINRETVQFLQKNTLNFYETGDQNFSFMHAKYMIIDDGWIISTANWTRSSFSSNREFFVIGKDALILKDLKNLFEADFGGRQGISYDNRIMTGPTNAREKFIQFIESADNKINLYMPNISDEKIISEFQKICSKGRKVAILLDKNEENMKNGNSISKNGCPEIRMMKTPSLHAKSLIIDDKEVFIGSFNFTKNSLDNNREIGIFINGKSISNIVNMFYKDWGKSIAF